MPPTVPARPSVSRPRRTRQGQTLAELAVVLAILGVVTLVAVARIGATLDRAGARGALADVAAVLATGRDAAVAMGAPATVRVESLAVLAVAGGDTVAFRPIERLHGATLAASRESLTWSPIGLATGAANLRVVARRGAAAETLTVSRLGRVRW